MSEQLHDLAALYVVDALSPEEADDFENHLAGCAECQREVVDMRSVTERLSGSVQADPPASLRAGVLAAVATTPQEPAVADAALADPAEAGPHPAADDASPQVVALRPRWSRRVPYLVAAAAVLLAVGFGGWALQSHHRAQQATAQQSELLALFGTADVQTQTATATGGGSGTLVLSHSRDQAVFVSAGMPTLGAGKIYELWTITGKAVPAGTFAPDRAVLVQLPDAALTAKQVAVTVEPAGGSAQPTTTPVMSLPVPPAA